MYKRALVATVALASTLFISAFAGSGPAHAANNGAAQTPPAGWSSWSFIRKNPTDANIRAQAKGMSDAGLVSHGFQYVNMDDFYYLNPSNDVDQYGRWVVDTSKFPNGMASLGSYIHGLGEKFGMYLTPGIPVAAYNQNTPIQGTSYHARDIVSDTTDKELNYNFPSSMYFIDWNKNPAAAQAYVNSWADLLASYGVDYLKMDGVHTSDQADVIGWEQALVQSGRVIDFGLSNSLDINNIGVWRDHANSWRISGDIECYCSTIATWSNVSSRWASLPKWAQYAKPGGWNDPDSLEVGEGSAVGLNDAERQSQLTLWAISKAPLLLGVDMTKFTAGDLARLKNDAVLNVDRNNAGAATPVSQASQQQVWHSPKNADGSYTVALFNLGGSTATVTANWSDLGFTGNATVTDLWAQQGLGTYANSISRSLGSHASALFEVTPGAAAGGTLVSNNSGRCADEPMSTTVNGTQIAVWDCNGGANQKIAYRASAKTLTVLGKCFDAHNNATTAGTHVEIYDCGSNKANQQWNLDSDGSITGLQSGLCLDVTGTTNPNGSGLELWTCNGGANQKWTLGAGVRLG